MAHVEKQRQINLQKKNMDAVEAKQRERDFKAQLKENTTTKRNVISQTQGHNKTEMTARMAEI